MANQICVTSAQITSKKERLEFLNGQFKKRLEEMLSTENALMGMWEGDASKAFNASFKNDVAKMENLYKAVGDYCKALVNIVDRYEASEKKNIALAKKRGK